MSSACLFYITSKRHRLTPSTKQAQFGKQYRSSQVENYRKSVFEENQEFIDNHNKKFEDGIVTFTLKMNQFGDLVS